MNAGVELLLERMKTHPEEFIAPPNTGASKWGHLIESYMDSLEPEDQAAIKEGYKKIHQQRFTEKVLEELVDPKSEKSRWGDMSTTLTGGQTHAQSMAIQQAYIAQQQAAIQQAQHAQQAPSTYQNILGNSGQGYLSALFGGSK